MKNIHLTADPFTLENGLMTPTFKVSWQNSSKNKTTSSSDKLIYLFCFFSTLDQETPSQSLL